MRQRYKRAIPASVLICCLVLLLTAGKVNAKLMILGPEQMLEQADFIAVGTVEALEPGGEDNRNTGTIRLDAVLKGDAEIQVVVLDEMSYMGDKAWLQRIPPAGTKVLLLLKKGPDGKPAFFNDSNHIAVIGNDKVVSVYKGINSTVQPYAETYDTYYQQHKGQAVKVAAVAGQGQPQAGVQGLGQAQPQTEPVAQTQPQGPSQTTAQTVAPDPPAPPLVSESGKRMLGAAAVLLLIAAIVWYELWNRRFRGK